MSILQKIVAQKEREVTVLPSRKPLELAKKSFINALRKRPSLIAEIKPRSPSRGELVHERDLSTIVDLYNSHAQAISVLCDQKFFGGGYDLLAQVRELTDLPILAKEFIIDQRQIFAARSAGADAVLLIGAILEKKQAAALAREAQILNMSVLFEVHEVNDLSKIPNLSPESLVIGINNRSLVDQHIDLTTTLQLAPIVRREFPDHLLMCESGIENRHDIVQLSSCVDGFLIGTSILTSKDRESFITSLFHSS